MRIQLISPYFPPDRGGVSDHSAILVDGLAAMNNTIQVLSCQNFPDIKNKVEFKCIPKNFTFLFRVLAQVKSFNPENIIIQFTPLAFSESFYGISFSLVVMLAALRVFSSAPILIIAHETGFPISLSIRGILLGIPHFVQFFLISLFANKIIFSHLVTKEYWARVLFWRRTSFSIVPVFSNIPAAIQKINVRQQYHVPENSKIILYFGGAHDMNLLDFVIGSYRRIQNECPGESACLCLLGISEEKFRAKIGSDGPSHVWCLGYQSSEVVSRFFEESYIVLAPFGEGLNSRRGSAMAAFSHGKAVVSTKGWCTKDDYPWDEFVKLAPAEDKIRYENLAVALFRNPIEVAAFGKAAKLSYEKYFTNKIVIQKIVKELRRDS